MKKSLKEMIEVMQHFEKGGLISSTFGITHTPAWDWKNNDYSIFIPPTAVAEDATIKIKRFYLNGNKTCAASFKDNGAEVCPFLLTSRFGTEYHCGLGMVEIDYETLKPHEDCVVWSDQGA